MQKLDQKFVEDELKKHGYLLLEEYKNANTPMTIMCPKGHISKKRYGGWMSGGRCGRCKHDWMKEYRRIYSTEDIKEKFLSKGWELLTEKYENAQQKLKFRCDKGHEHSMRWNDFRDGTNCGKCSSESLIGEENVRKIIETIFQKQFPKTRPKWLINPESGRSLELDGYNLELGLAFEFNGRYHYEQTCKEELARQQFRDKLKAELCFKNDVVLITIDHLNKQDLQAYILEQIKQRKPLLLRSSNIW